jgi:hypothetical protein
MGVTLFGDKVNTIYTVFRHEKLSLNSGELPTGEIIGLEG